MGKGMEAFLRRDKTGVSGKEPHKMHIQTEAATCYLGVCVALEVYHVPMEGQEALNQVILTATVRGAVI